MLPSPIVSKTAREEGVLLAGERLVLSLGGEGVGDNAGDGDDHKDDEDGQTATVREIL